MGEGVRAKQVEIVLDELEATRHAIARSNPGDLIVVEEDQRTFTALGALGGQTRVPLGNEVINAAEALAMVGGLTSALADPTERRGLRPGHRPVR